MLDTTERLQELFTEAIMDASVNYKSAVQQVVESKATPISNSEIITDGAVVTDGEGIKYSIKSMKHDIAEGKMFDDLKQYCGFTNKEINKLKARLEDLVQYMTLNREILDMNETYGREGRRFSPYKPNSDPLYTISLDHSTQCSKRLLTQYVIEQLQLRENRPMSAEEQMAIRDMLKEYGKIEKGIEVACVMCYVEAARLKSPKQINRWLTDPEPHLINYFAQKNPTFKAKVEKAQSDFKISKGYEANTPKKDMKPADRTALDKMSSKLRSQYKPTTVEKEIIKTAKSLPNSTYLTSGNLADLSESHPEIYKAYSTFVRSATRSKPLETDEPYYYGDSTRDNGNGIVVSDSFIETVNRENGMRFSSWSDWRIQHMLDWITAVIENSVRGAAMHGYTKYGDEVRVLGKTGMMFNMSGVAGTQTGLNEDGSLSFSDTESINYDEAIELREQFPETAGLQCIGVSVEHIFALLRSNIIDYVIPYHTSGLNAGLRRMGNIYGWKNFTSTQHATKDSSIKKENAVDPDNWHKEPVFSEFFVGYDTGLNGYEAMKKSAENYKRMCKERGLIPKFAEFANEDNYWKLLIDRKMVNQKTNTLIKQKPVSPVFDFDVIKSIVDKYVENYDSGLEQRALDYVVENWDYLPQRIRDLKKQGTAKAKTTRKAVNTLANETLAAQPNENDLKLSDRDSDYMSAVESGDMETAQRMVDEAAREAGYSVRAMHSTNADFTVFDISKTSANNFHGKGIYFTSSLKDLENNYENYEGPDPWQKIEDRAYELLDEKHGLSYDDTLTGDAEIIDLLNECYDEAIAEFNDSQRRITAYLKFDNPFVFEKGDDINASVDRTVYDGIVDKQVYENIGHSGMDENTVHYIVFNPNNIKSSAPVTYDENGNVIPLSKRFDSSESDIRYSDREIGYGKLTQDRINYLIDDSGAGSNVGYARAWIASINPTDFIDLTINYRTRMKGREAFDNNVRGDYNGLMADRDYISDLQNSRTIPRLKVDMDTGKVIGHDGRHRMRALEKAGASHTPVVIEFYKDDYLYKGNGDGVRLEAIDVQILTSQFDEIPILETHGSIYDIIPLNEDHRTEIEKNYLVKKTDVKYGNAIAYSDRDPDAITPRNLLANALESTAANDIERKKLEQYKKKIDSMNAEEKKLSEIRKEIKELSFGKGKRDTEKLKKLNAEATMTANRIATYDKQLLNLESTQAIKNVLEREKKKAVDRQKARDKEALKAYKEQVEQRQQKIIENYRESRKNATESRHRTEMRNKIKKVVNELNQYLLKGTKDKHVMEGMQKAVAEALSIVNMDTVDADARVAKYDALIAEATDPDVIESLTATRDRIQGQGDRLTDKLASLKSAYADIINSSDPTLSNAYDEVIEAKIASVVETVGDTSLRNMSMAQLEEVYDLYKMVLTNIRNANKLFASEKQGTIEQLGYEVDSEVKTATKQKDRMTAVNSFLRKVGYKDLKPIYFFRMLGSNTMTDLYKKVRDGQGTWFKDAVEARAFRIETERKYNYKQWDLKETYKFTAKSGKSFELTLPQIMSIYAFSRREQAFDHLIKGGIVFDDAVKVKEKKKGVTLSYTVNTSEAFNLSVDTLGEIIDTLTEEQKSYVKDMQSYLSDTMGGKGNEVALELYGVKLFKEKNYFPLKSSQYYMNFTAEEAGETKIKNSSFSKETVKHANNPIVLSDFIDVWANHVNDMSMYHSFVLPLEDFTRVYNYRTPTSEDVETTSVKSTIHNHYTEAANSYIKQLLKDINGGSVSGVGTEVIDKMVGLAKKGAVFASASVVVQQPSAIARAMAYVNPKYFVNVSSFNLKRHNQLWEECKQYAPVAGIKEMGYFDTSVGRTGIDWLKADEYDSVREKFFAFFKDKEQRRNIFDDALGFAPAMADELSWVALWEAVKKETRKTTDLEVGSEEFFKHCGERFTEVVDLTQVYDSVFARSELMRSKDRSVKMATSFMAEPTVQANMLFDAALQLKRGKMSALGSAASVVSAVVASVILNSLLKSFVTAGRDDDEEETYLEKYVASFTGDVINGMNPLTLIPFVKDLVSIVQGYSVDRMDMSVIDDLVTSVMNLGKESETPADDHKKWSSFVGSVAQMFGIPLKNIMRDVESTINIFSTFMSGNKTTSAGIASAIKEGLSGTTTAVIYDKLSGGNGIDVSKGKQYYDAVMNGNQDHANRIIESYGDAKKAETAIVKALKDFDPRVMEAAQAHVNGDTATRIRLTKEIIADGFAMNYVIKAVNNAINSINAGGAGESGGNVKSKYSNTDYFEAAYKGNSLDANAYKEDIIQADMKNNGKTRVEAEDSFNTNFRNLIKDAVEAGQITVEKATIMLTQYGGLSGEEALEKAQYYDFIAKHSDLEYNWQSNTVADYVDSAEPSGISVQVFDKYLVQKSKCKGVDKDGDGKVDSGSKKVQILNVINSLPLSSYQKDVLYRLNGWSASTIYQAPWH